MSNILKFDDLKHIKGNPDFEVEVTKVYNPDYKIPGYIRERDLVAELKTDSYKVDVDFIALIPSLEYELYSNRFPRENQKGAKFKARFKESFKIDDTYVLIFSRKDVLEEKRKPDLETFKNSKFIWADVKYFTKLGAVLKAEDLDLQLVMSNRAFSVSQHIKISDFHKEGDKIPVVYDTVKKAGREIRVTPFIEFPTPLYQRTLSSKEWESGTDYTGVIDHVNPNNISVLVGQTPERVTKKGKKINGEKIIITAPQPSIVYSDYIEVGTVVEITLTQKIKKNFGLGIIKEIDLDYEETLKETYELRLKDAGFYDQ